MDALRHCLTGKDNQTYDLVRVIGLIQIVSGIALQLVSMIFGLPFDIAAYEGALTAANVGTGLAAKAKESTEPQ